MLSRLMKWRRQRRENRRLAEANRNEPGSYAEPRSSRLVGMVLGRDNRGSRPPF